MLTRFQRSLNNSFYLLLCLLLLSGSSPLVSSDPVVRVEAYTLPLEFNYAQWTVGAFGIKLAQAALGSPYYFSPDNRHQVVVDSLQLTNQILQDENQVNLIYANPAVHDPAAASAGLRTAMTPLEKKESQLAPFAEAVLQEQVSETLEALGITSLGQPMPPVLFHISPLPYDLILSPRERIEELTAVSLVPDLSVDQQSALEDRVETGLDVSALVVPVGGIGIYPTMVMQSTDLSWLTDTIAHEWTHNWLDIRPLGLAYDSSPQVRTMNETTADIAGQEISSTLLARFYPELVRSPTAEAADLQDGPAQAGSIPGPTFDYNEEMHTTRVHVDALLAAGQVNQAEAYMDARRLVFWDNGYPIRKLNQAYFAFYGAYADVPGGAAGNDPVGPAVRALRAQSSTLAAFLETISRMSSFLQLQAAVSP